ncbi:hypothetical protein Avbf_19208 [Armadillidium vulgare]|nr:hypothetical protein Avbf_19208 [Armadillidium vulgare]
MKEKKFQVLYLKYVTIWKSVKMFLM